MKTAIKNLRILTPNKLSSENPSVTLLIEDGEIKDVISQCDVSESEGYLDYEMIDGSELIAIPGLTNAHYHSYANLLKGTVNDRPLDLWSLYTVAYGHSLGDEDMRLAVLLGAAEMIRNGVTAVIDHFPHLPRAEAAFSAYEESGLRAALAPMMHDIPDHEGLAVDLPSEFRTELDAKPRQTVDGMQAYYRRLLPWHGRENRLSLMVGPNAPQRCSSEMLKLSRDLSLEYGLRVHTHLLETRIQRDRSQERFPKGMVQYLAEIGLLNSNLSAAHAVWLSPKDIELVAEAGTTLVHNPVSNMMLGSGRAPVSEFKNAHIDIALGTDAANCSGPTQLFETMRQAILLNRSQELDYRQWLRPRDVWEMATLGGAAALGLKNKAGMITKGANADLVFLKGDALAFTPTNDWINQLVHHETGASVDSVMINGQWVLRQGKITTFDEQSVLAEARKRQEDMLERCQGALEFAHQLEPYFHSFYFKFHKLS